VRCSSFINPILTFAQVFAISQSGSPALEREQLAAIMIRRCTLRTAHVESHKSDDNSENYGEKKHCEAQNTPVLETEDEITIRVHSAMICESIALPSDDREEDESGLVPHGRTEVHPFCPRHQVTSF
jgi:hypothetical protein